MIPHRSAQRTQKTKAPPHLAGASASAGAGMEAGRGWLMSSNNIRCAPVSDFRCTRRTRDAAARYTKQAYILWAFMH